MLALCAGMVSGRALEISLFESALNRDGTVTSPPSDQSSFDFSTGLGTLEYVLSGAGSHYLGLFLDHGIDESMNTYFNEFGAATGTLAAGQSWETDEPGYTFGNIYDHLEGQTLDNSNGVPNTAPDDVSMALAWDFVLRLNQTATIGFTVGESAPDSGFYLSQTDPDSSATVYFSSLLDIRDLPPTAVPDAGSTFASLGLALAGLAAFRRRQSAT